jgi:hypothetical protein
MKPGTKIGVAALASVALMYMSSLLGSSVGTARWNSELTKKRVDNGYGLADYLTDSPDSLLNSNLFAWIIILAIVGGSAYVLWKYVKRFTIDREDDSNQESGVASDNLDSPSTKIPSWILVVLALVMFYSYSSARTSSYQALKDDSQQEALGQMTPEEFQLSKEINSAFDNLTPKQVEQFNKRIRQNADQ